MKYLKYVFLLGLLFLLLNNISYAMTFEEYLNYWGSQENSTQMDWTYNFIYNLYYDSVTDFTNYLSYWDSSTDSIYTEITNTSSNLARTLNITFINNENINYYKEGNYIRFTSGTTRTKLSATFNNSRNEIINITTTDYTNNFINTNSGFYDPTNATKFLISDNLIYSDNSLTNVTSADYYYKKVYTNTGFKYVDNPIYTNYINQYIKLGEFIGGVDYSNVRVQFGFLNQDNTMGQIIALYGYPDSTLPKLYINNNNLYIDSRLITSDSYAISVVIDNVNYDNVRDIYFVNSSGSGESTFSIQDGTNNIINNNNNNKNDIIQNQNQNTDKIISAITNPFNPNSGDYLLNSGDILAGFDYENGYINFFNTLLNILRDVFINRNQRSVNLGELPILNGDFVLDLDGNLKCPYPPMLVDFIQIFSNGAIVFFIFKFGYRLYELFVTGDIDNLLLNLETSSYSFIHWF